MLEIFECLVGLIFEKSGGVLEGKIDASEPGELYLDIYKSGECVGCISAEEYGDQCCFHEGGENYVFADPKCFDALLVDILEVGGCENYLDIFLTDVMGIGGPVDESAWWNNYIGKAIEN